MKKRIIPVVLVALVVIAILGVVGYPNIINAYVQISAKHEISSLRSAAAMVSAYTNPPAVTDNFAGPRPDIWPQIEVNGGGLINTGPAFHAAEYKYGPDGLTMFVHDDPFFQQETGMRRYNNVAFMGMRGFRPSPQEDVVMQCVLEITKPFFGTAGCILEPVNMISVDGSIPHMDFFGVSIIGPESDAMGKSGPTCSQSIDWMPVYMETMKDVDIYRANTYGVRLSWQDNKNMTGIVTVNGVEKCGVTNIPLMTTETQLWDDQYFTHGITIGYQNRGEKKVIFHQVSVRTEPRR